MSAVQQTGPVRTLFRFPDPVNEFAARSVAGLVVVLCATTLAGRWWWLSALIAAGFLARVATGPTLSPFGQLATRVIAPRVIAPRWGERPVPGPPKRFAQAIGFVLSTLAAVSWFAFGNAVVTAVALAMITVAALLESVFGLCLGCTLFGLLIRAGVVPESVCEACADVRSRWADAPAA